MIPLIGGIQGSQTLKRKNYCGHQGLLGVGGKGSCSIETVSILQDEKALEICCIAKSM